MGTDFRRLLPTTLYLAQVLFQEQRYDEALPLFEVTVDTCTARDNPTLAQYLVALFYSQQRPGALAQALDIAGRLRQREGVAETVSEVEANLLREVGRSAEARQIFVQLSDLDPHRPSYRLRAIQLALLLKEEDAARAELAKIPESALWNDAPSLMQAAEFRGFLQMPDALRFAYRALRLRFGEAQMHRAYINLFLHITRDYSGEEPGPLDSPAASSRATAAARFSRSGTGCVPSRMRASTPTAATRKKIKTPLF